MMADTFFTGITKRRWTGYLLIWGIILALFAFLYINARRAVLNEIRHQALGVAIAVAAGLDPADLAAVQNPGDEATDAYRRVQGLLGRVAAANPDVRYLYTMRRSQRDDAPETEYEFIVDGPERDANQDGKIDRDEASEPVGRPYDASLLPELMRAWYAPTADRGISPDPPYPDLMSGYAPVKNALGQTVGLVGADITAATVRTKLVVLQIVIAAVWFVLSLLILLVVQLYYRQHEALETNTQLGQELALRNEMLHAANAQLARHNEQFRRELKLAQSVQLGFLPKTFPRQDKIIFDKYYLTCEMLGGDLFDVFTIDDDHVGMYMADVAGHGASAALISGLLKMAVASVRDRHATATSQLHANLTQPDRVLAVLNDMLKREIPDYEFITMIYAVLDIPGYQLAIASAGHPPPLVYNPLARAVGRLHVSAGPALGLEEGQAYTVLERTVAVGDKMVFYTDGITEAMNEAQEEFGEARLIEVIRSHGGRPPSEMIAAVRQALEDYRGTQEVSDDYSILVAEIR